MFCPQCGNPIVRNQETADVPSGQTTALHTVATADDSEKTSQTPPPVPTEAAPPTPNPAAPVGVVENVRDRVEKIRHVSSAMIDQAAYDPSLRFLLVAALLFLLFIVLVILSKVLG